MNNNLVKVTVPVQTKESPAAVATPSVTRGYYQVMPTVASNGKNILKLIPVKKVGGQFVQLQAKVNVPSTYKKPDAEPTRFTPSTIQFSPATVSSGSVPILQQPNPGKYILKAQPDGKIVLNPVSGPAQPQQRMPFASTSSPVQVQVPMLPQKRQQSFLPVGTPLINAGKTVSLLNMKQLPVTVKSPVLPNGHYLQIPANAEVKSVPTSALPHAIKKKILAQTFNCSSTTSDPTRNVQTVIYVSPVNTINTMQTVPVTSASQALSQLLKVTTQPVGNNPGTTTTQPGKPPSNGSQSSGQPIKWVVQENPDSPAPCLVPINSRTMTSSILKTLAQIEKAEKTGQNVTLKTNVSQNTQPNITSGKDNALVMCNGKVYFVAKKTSEFTNLQAQPHKAGESINKNPTQTPEAGCALNQQNQPSPKSQPSSSTCVLSASNVPALNTEPIVIKDGPDEIVDLCSEGLPDGSTSQQNENCNVSQPSTNQTASIEDDEDSNVIFVSYIPPKTTTSSSKENESIPVKLPSTQTQLEKSPVDLVQEQSTPALEENQKCESDSQLRKRFGIRSEIKIRLQQIRPPESKPQPEKMSKMVSINRCTLEGIRKLIRGANIDVKSRKRTETENAIQSDGHSPQKRKTESNPHEMKKRKIEILNNPPETASLKICKPPASETVNPVSKTSSAAKVVENKGNDLCNQTNVKVAHENSGLKVTSPVSEARSNSKPAVKKSDSPMKKELSHATADPIKILKATEPLASGSDMLSKTVVETAKPAHAARDIGQPPASEIRRNVAKPIPSPERSKTTPSLLREMPDPSPTGTSRTESQEIKAPHNILPKATVEESREQTWVPANAESSPPVEICTRSVSGEGHAGLCSGDDLYMVTPMDAEEIVREEKIKRLKELLRQKEAALDAIRKKV
ncbi:ligand-dependent nuclear receptor-interacting factor 1 [Amia ocellicauda]|uniref:ligand-dependent nuclear receptor-interacting factor 1 n=1 Tax=Amia ocellicauda TaxID=2972642 RepID=UPI0034639BD8